MRRIYRIALFGVMACVLAAGGSALAAAKGHGHRQAHANVADVIKDVKDTRRDSADASKDKSSAQQDVTAPDSPAVAQQEQADGQNEQLDNQTENQDGNHEGDNRAQAIACQGLPTDNVQYDDQTGTCTAETGHDNGTAGQDNTSTGGQGTGAATGGQDNNQNG